MLKSFASNRSGNFGMMAALLSLPLFGAAALAVDYVNAASHRASIQNAVDAAVLAAAASGKKTEKEMRVVAEKALLSNVDKELGDTLEISGFVLTSDGQATINDQKCLPQDQAAHFQVRLLSGNHHRHERRCSHHWEPRSLQQLHLRTGGNGLLGQHLQCHLERLRRLTGCTSRH